MFPQDNCTRELFGFKCDSHNNEVESYQLDLDEYITTNGSDIVTFNAYVQSQINGLATRGEITSDLLVNLFKGYKTVKDKPFLDYLQMIENGHEDSLAVVDAPHLMLHAVNFYKNRLTRKQWEQKSKQEWGVLALEAKVEQLQKNVQCKAKQVQVQTMPMGKGTCECKSTKKEQKPVKPDWLAKYTPLKPEVIKQYHEWNGTKWYWCCEENRGKCVGVVKRTEVNVAVHGLHTYPHSVNGSASIARIRSCLQRRIQQGQKRKSDALKLSTVNKAIVEATQWENNDEQEHDYRLDAEYQEM